MLQLGSNTSTVKNISSITPSNINKIEFAKSSANVYMYYIYTNAIHTSLKVLISQRGEIKYINQQIYLLKINVGHLKIIPSFSDLTHNLSYRLDCSFYDHVCVFNG